MQRLVALFAILLVPVSGLRAAAPAVWSALVLATKEDHPQETPPELRRFAPKLGKIFGYNQFELIGQHTELMDDPSERWLIPSKNFCLRVLSRKMVNPGYLLKLQLFQDQRTLADFEANLSPQNPLFIRGPMYAGGQLVIVMVVK